MSLNSKDEFESIAAQNGIILLYHSVADSVPAALQDTLHNVCPGVLQEHLGQLCDFFEFVSLEEFSDADEKRGLAAITFDDGYKNVLENALPVLEAHDCPFTFFLNPLTFKGRWNWRDKVRYLIHHELIDDFEKEYKFDHQQGLFYRYSKHPKNNSAELDKALDRFLGDQEITIYPSYPYLQAAELISHPLVTYGNHSLNHYVLSSLSIVQQQYEIELAMNALDKFTRLKISSSFSVPFGGSNDINSGTISVLNKLGYESLLMSRQRLQPNQAEFETIQLLERFMPRTDDIISEMAVIK